MRRLVLLLGLLLAPPGAQARSLAVVDSIPLPLPERSNGHLLAAAVLGHHLLAGGEHGLYAHDGQGWSRRLDGGAIRWLGEADDGALWAGGDRGLWSVHAAGEGPELRHVEGAPEQIRDGAVGPGGQLWLATDRGLFTRGPGDDGWSPAGPTSRIEAVLLHERWGVVAGSFGGGLYLRRPGAEGFERIRCEAPGTTTGLPGDFVHALDVDAQGRLVVASSYGRLDPAFRAWQNMREAGHIDGLHPHDFRRAARSTWDGQEWVVDYLVQDAGRSVDTDDLNLVFQGDGDGDGRTEIWLRLDRVRDLHPRGLFCFDKWSGELEWSLPTWSRHTEVFPLPGPGPRRFLVAVGAIDQGFVHPGGDDGDAALWLVDGRGQRLRSWPLPHATLGAYPVYRGDGPGISAVVFQAEAPVGVAQRTLDYRVFDVASLDWRPGVLRLPGRVRLGLYEHGGRVRGVATSAGPTAVQFEFAAEGDSFRVWTQPRGAADVNGILALYQVDAADGWRGLQRHAGTGDALPLSGPAGVERLVPLRGEVPLEGAVAAEVQVDAAPYGSTATLLVPRGAGRSSFEFFVERAPAEAPAFEPDPGYASGLVSRARIGRRAAPTSLQHVATVPARESDRRLGIFRGYAFARGGAGGSFTLVSATPGPGGGLPVYGRQGRVVQHLPLPPWLEDGGPLGWAQLPHVFHGSPWAILSRLRDWPLEPTLLDLRTGAVAARYDFGLPYVASALFSVEALGEGGALAGGRGGLVPWPGGHSARGVAWERRSPRVHAIGSASGEGPVLVAGDDGVRWLGPGAELVDREVRGLAGGDSFVSWLRPRDFRRCSDRADSVTTEPLAVSQGLGGPRRVFELPAGRYVSPNEWYPARFAWPVPVEWTLREGWSREVRDIHPLPGGDLLLAHDGGLTRVDPAGPPVAELGAEGSRYNDLQPWRGRLLAAREDGVLEWVGDGGGELARELRGRLPAGRPVRQLVAGGGDDGPELWAVHARALTRLEPPGPTVPVGVDIHRADARAGGGLWVAGPAGLSRFDAGRGRLVPVRPTGLPAGAVRDVRERPGPAGPRLWVLMASGELYRFPLPRGPAGSWLASWDARGVDAVAWPPQARRVSTVLARADGRGAWVQLGGQDGQRQAPASFAGRGRHRLELAAYDQYGRAFARTIDSGTRVIRAHSVPLEVATQLLFAVGGAVWLALYRRWPPLWGGLVYAGLGVAWLLVVHGWLLYELPWRSTLAMGGTLAAMGVVVRLAQGRPMDRRQATERLWELVEAFHHSSAAGLAPTDAARGTWANFGYMHSGEGEFLDRARELLQRLLEDTEDLARELEPVGRASAVDPALLSRCLVALGAVRQEALEATVDPEALWALVRQPDRRVRFVDLLEDFDRCMGTLNRRVARRRGCELGAVLREHQRGLEGRRAGGLSVELRLPAVPLQLAVPYGELLDVLENLSGNAVHAMGGQASPRLRLGGCADDAGATVWVEDNGPGIPPAQRAQVVERGVSLRGSSGFGLWHCQQLAEGWGAELVLGDSAELGGCRVEIRGLPLAGDDGSA